jgi:putative methyltransferase (TIGR04325 family)
MKDLLRQLIPPVLLNVLKPRSPPIFHSYEEARDACLDGGYQGSELVKVVVEKNLIFKRASQSNPIFGLSSLRSLIGVGLANTRDELNVLDFGGGAGYHYTLAKAALGRSKNLRWNVVETPAMVKDAKRLADAHLNFFDSIASAKSNLGFVDLVFTSSALQYCPNPLEFLRELTQVGAKYLFITRTPFNASETSITSIQVSRLSENGPGPLPPGFDDRRVSYPITFASKQEAEKILNEKYEIRFSIKEDKRTFRAGSNTFDMYGYFCSQK